MYDVFMILFAIALMLFIVGLIRPGLVVSWSRRETRGRVLSYYGTAALVLLVFVSIIARKDSTISHSKKPQILRHYSELAISDVSYIKGNVQVRGTTDLPNGTLLNTNFDIEQKSTAPYLGSSGGARVQYGKFSSTIVLKPYLQYTHGPYVVTVLCTPLVQSSSIVTLLGKDGQELIGPLVQNTAGQKVLQTSKRVNLTIKVVPIGTNLQKPFSSTNPVPTTYLRSYLTWMNQFYVQLKNHAAALQSGKIGLSTWSKFMEQNNVEGWNRYHAVDYPANVNIEDPMTYRARTDVAKVWSVLNTVGIDYDSYLSNHSLSSKTQIPSDELQYEKAYKQALNDMKKWA